LQQHLLEAIIIANIEVNIFLNY